MKNQKITSFVMDCSSITGKNIFDWSYILGDILKLEKFLNPMTNSFSVTNYFLKNRTCLSNNFIYLMYCFSLKIQFF